MMKKIPAFFALAAAAASLAAEEIPLTGADFRLGKFKSGGVECTASFQDGVLTVEVTPTSNITNETRGAVLAVPPEKLIGKGVRFQGEVRYENIASDAGGPHVGGKILASVARDGLYQFFVTPSLKGTEEKWLPVSLYCTFPADQVSAHVVFGIQQGWGRIQFRNLTCETLPLKSAAAINPPAGFRCEYTDRVAKNVPRRGVMSPPWARLCEKDLRDLASWNVNLIRYQIVDGLKDATDLEEYAAWFDRALGHLEELMPILKECGIQVIVDMHVVPGGRFGSAAKENGEDPSHFRMMQDPECRDAFLDIWRKTAARLKGNPQVYAFDLCNEPIQHGDVRWSFWQLQYDAAKAIREVDPEVPIMAESNHMADPIFFEMTPMPLKNIIYSVHMYAPGPYTHQGVNDDSYVKTFPSKRFDYRDAGWDRARLRKAVDAVRQFQQKYGAKIQVGEFSAAVWAPGAAAYLDDVASIFEEYGWDWSYHAFREWEGWSLEHEGTPTDLQYVGDTDRKQALLKYFLKNRR